MCLEHVGAILALQLFATYGETEKSLPVIRGGLGASCQRRLLDYIEAHFTEEISLDQLAQEAGLTDLVQGVQRLDETAADLINARLQNVDLAKLTCEMADAFQRVHSSNEIHVIAKETGKAWVAATEDSLETVLENLLDNAIGFSPQGGTVTMTVSNVESMVRLIVEDEGPGVPVDQMESIFRRNFSSRPTEGKLMSMDTPHFGIGLAIVRRTVEILGGHIRAENRPDGGLRITIDFPTA